ncbi:MAG: hypothetical protein KF745_02980 [Phycisphaeraceae bacterium]|nr:hypothetical protein [Phycisphaeraceae bacterium]
MKMIRIASVCLALGAVVNVLVAWACASMAAPGVGCSTGVEGWPVAVQGKWAEATGIRVEQGVGRAVYRGTTRIRHVPGDIPLPLPPEPIVDCAGLPMLSMVYFDRRSVLWLVPESWFESDGWLGPYDRGVAVRSVRLPLRPLWGGFVVNTLVYGLSLFAVVAVCGAICRRSRRRRGLCERCAYPRSGGVCSECGCSTTGETLR